MKPIAIYIHIPYCLYKCHYCDFNSYPTQEVDSLESEYVNTLLKEMEETVNYEEIIKGGEKCDLLGRREIG